MIEPLSSHRRDRPERVSEILNAATSNRITVLSKELRGGHQKIVLRCINDTPRRYHLWRLNEHGAYINDREIDSRAAQSIVWYVKHSNGFIGYERGPAEKLWPGSPHQKHPSWSGGDRR